MTTFLCSMTEKPASLCRLTVDMGSAPEPKKERKRDKIVKRLRKMIVLRRRGAQTSWNTRDPEGTKKTEAAPPTRVPLTSNVSNSRRPSKALITPSIDDREIADKLVLLRNRVRGFSGPFYSDKQYNHQNLVSALRDLHIEAKLARCSESSLKKFLEDSSARRSFVSGLVWVALEIWIFENAQKYNSLRWSYFTAKCQNPLSTRTTSTS
ncbi:hypothetical protein BDD12DRAFT_805321 [Trichophaea hybrida]|nr:hypothetical protein BDD12DRAFT_805321 [Trichophaea hybrida]